LEAELKTPPKASHAVRNSGIAPAILLVGWASLNGDWLAALAIFFFALVLATAPTVARYVLAALAVRHLTDRHILSQRNLISLVRHVLATSSEK